MAARSSPLRLIGMPVGKLVCTEASRVCAAACSRDGTDVQTLGGGASKLAAAAVGAGPGTHAAAPWVCVLRSVTLCHTGCPAPVAQGLEHLPAARGVCALICDALLLRIPCNRVPCSAAGPGAPAAAPRGARPDPQRRRRRGQHGNTGQS